MPANDAYRPISAANARILGKVVAILRKVSSAARDLAQPATGVCRVGPVGPVVRGDL